MSGLSKGVAVIEAPEKSGALATAKFALDQNRDVFVVPGRADDPNYIGGHRLIKSGAALITSPEDIMDAYGMEKPAERENGGAAPQNLGKDEQRVYETLRQHGTPLAVDKISAATTLPIHIVTSTLTFLQLKGIIRESGGSYELNNS